MTKDEFWLHILANEPMPIQTVEAWEQARKRAAENVRKILNGEDDGEHSESNEWHLTM